MKLVSDKSKVSNRDHCRSDPVRVQSTCANSSPVGCQNYTYIMLPTRCLVVRNNRAIRLAICGRCCFVVAALARLGTQGFHPQCQETTPRDPESNRCALTPQRCGSRGCLPQCLSPNCSQSLDTDRWHRNVAPQRAERIALGSARSHSSSVQQLYL